MRILLFVFLFQLALNFGAIGQYYSWDTIVQIDANDVENKFILVANNKNQKAAERINTFLQYEVLQKCYKKGDTDVFSVLFDEREEFGGQDYFDFRIITNNSKIFSLEISYEGTGAYTESYNSYYNFAAETGDHIELTDIFPYGALVEVSELVSERCISEIDEFLKDLESGKYRDQYEDEEVYQEYSGYQKELYEDCKTYFENSTGAPYDFWLEKDKIVFINERCSNHAMAAVDELWTFETDMMADALTFYMTENGSALFGEGKWDFKRFKFPEHKILHGVVGGKYPITGMINGAHGEGSVSGVYWYNKYNKPIRLSGKFVGEDVVELQEAISGAKLRLELDNGNLKGTWKKDVESKELSFDLSH